MPKPHRPLTVVAILLSMFVAAMEGTVVATAMPTIVSELHGLPLYGWVSAVYMLATTVTIPLWGKLADLHGRKPSMLAGLAIFALGSIACGACSSMAALIAFRGLQGIGAGALQPIALTMVGDLFSIEERAKMQGVFGAVWGSSAMLGPLLGGFLVHHFSWPWIFYINVPVSLLAAALLAAFYHDPPASDRQRTLDLVGAALLTLGVLALLAGVSGYSARFTLPLALVLLALFCWSERKASEPILPFDLFTIPAIRAAGICNVLMGAVMMGALMYTPLYVQSVLHTTPTGAGASVAPMLVGWPLASTLSGRLLPRVGYRMLVRVGLTLTAISTLALWWVCSHGVTLIALQVAMFAFGTGMGLANTALVIAVQESVGFQRRGVATAASMFFRMIGGTVAVGALGVLVAHAVRHEVSPAVLSELLGPAHGASLPPALFASASAAMQRGMLPVFLAVAVLGALVGVSGWMFPRVRTQRTSLPSPTIG
jgi:EmrB/QacA subfamily drug resistance transporter